MTIIIWCCSILLALLLVSLIVPWRISLCSTININSDTHSVQGVIQIGGKNFGVALVLPQSIHIGPFNHPWLRLTKKKKKKIKIKKAKKRKPPPLKYMKAMMRSIQWDQLSLTGQFSLKNTSHTGLVYGVLQLMRLLVRSNRINLDIKPKFQSDLDVNVIAMIRIKLVPIGVGWLLLKTYLNFK